MKVRNLEQKKPIQFYKLFKCHQWQTHYSLFPSLSTIIFLIEMWSSPFTKYLFLLMCYILQFSSVVQSCQTLCNPMDYSTPDVPAYHQLPELTKTHVYWVGDAIQPSHPLSSLFPPTFNLFQHQNLSKWLSFLHQVGKVLELQPQHRSFQWIFKTDFL